MSTRSIIARLQEDGKTYDIRYIHSDGYPEGVGHELMTHYKDPAKVEQLFALGDLSYLDQEIGEPHDGFGEGHLDGKKRPEGANWTRAYHRDRGEELRLSTTKKLIEGASNYWAEYVYQWTGETWRGYSVSYANKRLYAIKIPA